MPACTLGALGRGLCVPSPVREFSAEAGRSSVSGSSISEEASAGKRARGIGGEASSTEAVVSDGTMTVFFSLGGALESRAKAVPVQSNEMIKMRR